MASQKSAKALPALSGKQVIGLIGGIVLYHEFSCDDEQLISDEFHRQRKKHPVTLCSLVIITAGHLIKLWPEPVDPYSGFGFSLLTKLKGTTE